MKKTIFKLLLLSTLIISCNNEFENSNLKEPTLDKFEQEIAFPNRFGEVSDFEMKDGKKLFYTKIDTFKVFEGDILLSNDLLNFLKKENEDSVNNFKSKYLRKIKSAPAIKSNRWSNSTVNFKISLTSRRNDILWAINHIRNNTNINFVESGTGNYIDFIDADGCSSYIGMTGGRQQIRLASGCGRGSIVHEICHALGVFHEQSRPDRNSHLVINWGNIQSGRENNFRTELAYNYGNFDFGSIMMYNSWAFNPPGTSLPTITRLDGSTFGAQRIALSANDINALLDMYPGPNMIQTKGQSYENIIDVGANSNGDNVYIKNTRNRLSIYKNDILFSNNAFGVNSIDITSNGQIITNLSGYNASFYKTFDISEGGGNTYCLSKHQRNGTINLYKKNGNGWNLITRVYNDIGKRITVDSNGRPWILFDNSIRQYDDNGSYSSISKPLYSVTWDRLVDIGSAGNEIYVSMKNLHNPNSKQLLKYSSIANQLIRQPGKANYLDGQGNGVVWTN